jgi:hypothetical protein
MYAIDMDTSWALGTAVAAPIAAGLAVCAVGTTSASHRGRCLPTVGAAWLGLSFVGAMLLTHTHDDPSRRIGVWTIGSAFVLLPPLLATTSWHLFKRRKATEATTTAALPVPADVPSRAFALQQPKRRPVAAAGQVMVPLLATSF